MKTFAKICAFALTGLVLTASFVPGTDAVTVEQALADKKISITVPEFGDDGYSEGLRLNVKNISGKSLKLKVPKGTIFVPDNGGEQTLITSGDTVFALNTNQEKQIRRIGFCTELHDHGSKAASTFQLSFSKNANLLNILDYMDSLKVKDEDVIQHAVWCITDRHPVSYVYGEDTAAARLIQTRICSLTGQTMPWYETESEIIHPDPTIEEEAPREMIVEAHTVSGDLHFKSDTRTELQGMVKDSTGKIVTTNPRKMTCPPGVNVTFEYKLTVRGWAKGKYSVIYLNNGVEVINQPFEI